MYNVLVADDHPIVRMGVKNLVNQQDGYRVISEEATSIDVAIRAEQGDIDIIIMDLYMPPGENGLVTIKRIHEHLPQIKILVFSMHNESEFINHAIYNGAMGYVLKSSTTSELIRGLKQVARGEKYLDNNIMVTKEDLLTIKSGPTHLDIDEYLALSDREREVLPLIVLGYTNKEIAAKLYISTKTVEAHKANIMHKLRLKSHAELIRYAFHHHLINI
ncbi:response regulator transcription factor [Limosilactobacillus sp. STM2_1]|uniref:Response regulator transcription factor n=1 Tax=Limosilactobacillus rudii TaxID=2759755 RepID=A0A7W3UJZ8_9LACO|nr:response regulator transcription factor [Limosilactobacillus rudii]MBB1079153.1 response regulator transcription factor [Limosilactobacillus rudii]MBB1096972.1 response regulator transcription factor [Limosilactobacillus rudii]MCD7133940.1 response regulator transcription factor [Limosilactobacillus rudii]